MPIAQASTDAFSLADQRATSRNVTIENKISNSPLVLQIDEVKMKRFLLNLLTKAIKFVSPGTPVVLDVSETSLGAIELTCRYERPVMTEDEVETTMSRFG